jgi:flagellar biosynthesis protein FliQ
MTGPEVMDVARDAIVTLVVVASPLMLVGLVVGVAISYSRRSPRFRR